jgi:hypothetical protein
MYRKINFTVSWTTFSDLNVTKSKKKLYIYSGEPLRLSGIVINVHIYKYIYIYKIPGNYKK